MPQYIINIWVEGYLVDTIPCVTKAIARKVYFEKEDSIGQYTQLVVNGVTYSTTKAKRHFGNKTVQERATTMSYPSKWA